MKYYNYPYPNEGDNVYPLDYFISTIEDNDSMIIEECKRDYGNGFMWCKEFGEHIESGDGSCGILCEHYNPCNGRTGRCAESVNTMTGSGKLFKISCTDGKIDIKELQDDTEK